MCTAISHTARMAAYLLESGWELHLNNNSEITPTLWKARRNSDDEIKVQSVDVSHDDVLELHQTGILEQHHQFGVGIQTVTVFRLAETTKP
jgi:hypothetical protein